MEILAKVLQKRFFFFGPEHQERIYSGNLTADSVGIGNGIISLLWGFEQKYWRKHSVGIGYMVLVLVSTTVKVLESQ